MDATEEDIQPWLRYAECDMASAEALHRAVQDLNAIFDLQQAVEKTLRALLSRKTGVNPPRIHSLRKLAEQCGLKLTAEQSLVLENLTEYYVEWRYPGDWEEVSADVVSKETARLISAAGEFIQWLQSQI
jgi:HEPN domain-containing protein